MRREWGLKVDKLDGRGGQSSAASDSSSVSDSPQSWRKRSSMVTTDACMSMSTSTAFILGVWNSRRRSSALTRSAGLNAMRSASKSEMTMGSPVAGSMRGMRSMTV